jgi:hypothetical protein
MIWTPFKTDEIILPRFAANVEQMPNAKLSGPSDSETPLER